MYFIKISSFEIKDEREHFVRSGTYRITIKSQFYSVCTSVRAKTRKTCLIFF